MDQYTAYKRVQKNSLPKLREEIGGTKTIMHCHGTKCRICVLAALRTVELGLTKVGNEANPLQYSFLFKVLFRTNLEQMLKRKATDLDTQPTTTQQRHVCAQKYQVAAAPTIREIRSSSESTGDL